MGRQREEYLEREWFWGNKSINMFIASIRKEFERYKLLGEKTFLQLSDAQLFHLVNEQSNSIAIIVQHLHGNMLSRWTDFLTTDGEKTWRKRDEEFEQSISDRSQLLSLWEEGWTCLFAALYSLTESDLSRVIHIRGEAHTVLSAIHRQLAHYAYHVGQIVFMGKMLAENWETLSIAKRSNIK